ncbi:MAG: helix-turn-helix domain-containing protein [Anaerolineales bacterium]|jgi:transcriptional regulator with XRE-family HTH domain
MGNSSAFEIQTKKLGDLIKGARISSDKSIEECAKAMGIPPSEYEAYELGEKSPSLPEVEAFSFYLDIPIEFFWNQKSQYVVNHEKKEIGRLDSLISLRHRIIGITIRKARVDAGISVNELAQISNIDPTDLSAYEIGSTPIPLPELETIAVALNLSVRDFLDQHGPIGKWAIQKKAIEDFSKLPLEMQQFISKPVNQPYLELAQRLSEMSVERLRAVAEGLLEITL